MPNPNESRKVEQPEIEWKQIVSGCSACDWTIGTSVPADIIPGSQADRALMSNLEFRFNKHNFEKHKGEARLTYLGDNLPDQVIEQARGLQKGK